MKRKEWVRLWLSGSIGLTLFAFYVGDGEAHAQGPGSGPTAVGVALGVAAVLVWIIPPTIAACIFVWRMMGNAFEKAGTPIPEPAQIKQQLEIELGESVSIADAIAVHEYLVRRRNEGLLTAGAGLLGAYMVVHHF